MVALDDLVDLARTLLEALDVLALMPDEADCDEGGQASAVGFRVDDRLATTWWRSEASTAAR